MSVFMVVVTEEKSFREKEKLDNKEILELRVDELEKKLQEIKSVRG